MSNTKKIGVACDPYKANKYRKGLIKDGFVLEYDGKCEIPGVHLFRIEVPEEEFEEMTAKIGKTTRRLEIEFKQSN